MFRQSEQETLASGHLELTAELFRESDFSRAALKLAHRLISLLKLHIVWNQSTEGPSYHHINQMRDHRHCMQSLICQIWDHQTFWRASKPGS